MKGVWLEPARRHRRLVVSLAAVVPVVLLLVFQVWRSARRDAPLVAERVPVLGRSAVTLARGIHLLGGVFPSVVYALESSDGLVLIDSGVKADASTVKRELATLGLDWRRVRAVLLTHAHLDHSGGAEFLRTSTGAMIYAGKGDAAVLRAGGPREAYFSTFDMPGNTAHPTTVDVELEGDECLAFGDVRLQVLATPGHTPGSLCYLLVRKNLRVLFTGDVVMKLRGDDVPDELAKPLGTYTAYLAPRYRGNARDFLASLLRLRTIPVPDLVLPGHPIADPVPESPCLSQERWETLLDQGIADMRQLVARYEHDGADFLDGTPRRLLPDLYYLGDFQGIAAYAFSVGPKLYVVGSPCGPGFSGFVTAGLSRLGLTSRPPSAILLTSASAAEIEGLGELIQTSHLQVVAPGSALDAVKKVCPAPQNVVAAKELSARRGFSVTSVPLAGRGHAPLAYLMPWAGKTVLLTGRIPIANDAQEQHALLDDFKQQHGNPAEYLESLSRLEGLNPDLWLPAVPMNGQNANVYGSTWRQVIEDNRNFVRASRWNL
jgi:glyoxylase-like metal-dependent hydrolase (beta-lactamase superfamily II)